jgi:hypothetical protein
MMISPLAGMDRAGILKGTRPAKHTRRFTPVRGPGRPAVFVFCRSGALLNAEFASGRIGSVQEFLSKIGRNPERLAYIQHFILFPRLPGQFFSIIFYVIFTM